MEDSVIANNPILIVGFIAALLLGGYGLIKKARFCVTGLSVFLFLSTERGSHVRQTSIDRCIGVIFIVLALGIFYAQAGTLSPRAILASFNLWMLVPLLFIAVGVLCLARGLFKQPPQ